MSIGLIFTIVIILFIVFLAFGMYIHSILLAAGIIGIALLEGPSYIVGFLQSDPFLRTTSYTLTTIPLFVIMAQFVVKAGIVEDLYNFVFNVSKGKRGLLGILTIIAGGFLGAVSGSTNASAAAMGQVAVPQLIKRGYNEGIAGATVAAAGSLSSVIPPSIVLILWGVATETPIGKLFIGSVIPGIIIMVIISIVMLIFLRFYNGKKEDLQSTAFVKETLPTSKVFVALGLTGMIVVIVFGGIYLGFFTPTEAGAVGAFAGFLVALFIGKVNLDFLKDSFTETVKITAMILMIMIGAQIFGRFVSLSLLPRKLISALSALIEYPILILIIIAAVYFILFMFIEGAAVIVMTAPIVLPLINEIGTDLIWFGVLVGILCTIGLLTPPVGLSVYSVAGVTGIKNTVIFRYALPYALIITVVIFAIMVVFPEIVTWLPNRM
ncbi:TRAP transporter large permease [Oceanobacillus sp. CAU 1775]